MRVMSTIGLEPLAEVQGALLVVEVLHLPHPQLLGLLHVGEHLHKHTTTHVNPEPVSYTHLTLPTHLRVTLLSPLGRVEYPHSAPNMTLASCSYITHY